MLYPTIDELTKGKYNRYELALATAKCARLITEEYVRQHDAAEKSITGNKETDKPLNTMIDHMIHGGRIALLGLLRDDTKIDWSKVIFNGLIIKGIYGRQMHETWYKMSAMLQGGLDISKIITHRMPVTDYEKGFAAMNSGQCGKVILNWE